MTGFSGLLSFELEDDLVKAHRFVDNLKYFNIGVSWGGFESLVLNLARDGKNEAIPKGLIRISVGLEHVDDLISDLDQALSLI